MKQKLSALLMTSILAVSAYANNHHLPHQTVADAIKAENYSSITLSGKIIAQIDEKRYLFQDDTGTIELKADKKKQKNLQVSSANNVLIYGKVDHYGKKTEIDVKSITPQKP